MAVMTTVVMKLSNTFTLAVNDSKYISKIPRVYYFRYLHQYHPAGV